jgi:hypothetical protein
MTVEEARTIWLTMLGSDWQKYVDLISHPMFMGTLDSAYVELRDAGMLERDVVRELVKIKCKS